MCSRIQDSHIYIYIYTLGRRPPETKAAEHKRLGGKGVAGATLFTTRAKLYNGLTDALTHK